MSTTQENRELVLSAVQLDARNKAIKEGKIPDFIFAINKEACFDVKELLNVMSFDTPENIGKSLDEFIFSYLHLLSESEDNGFYPDIHQNIYIIKQIRDAFVGGVIQVKSQE
jgi:hypothetical protein